MNTNEFSQKVLVTGGAGFIGSYVAAELVQAGHEVHVLDNLSSGKMTNLPKKAKFHNLDLRDTESIAQLFIQEKYETIFHLAAQMSVIRSVANPLLDTEINVRGLINLMEAGKATGLKKVIFSSSGGVIYGDPVRIPQDEAHPLRPASPYGISKLACENYLRYYQESFGIDHVCLRYANVYGPRQNPESGAGLIAIFMRKILDGQQPIIHGSGKKTRDYVFVEDVAKANLLALNYEKNACFNIGTGIETDVNTVFHLVKKYCQSNVMEVHDDEVKGEQQRSVLDNSAAKRELGWQPKVMFAEGLKRTIDWYCQENGVGEQNQLKAEKILLEMPNMSPAI